MFRVLLFAVGFCLFSTGFWYGLKAIDSAHKIAGPRIANADMTRVHPVAAKKILPVQKAALKKKNRVEELLRAEIAMLQLRVGDEFDQNRTLKLEKVNTAYPMAPPKLFLSAKFLGEGVVTAVFGSMSRTFFVAERFDFTFEGCDCYLTLMESRQGYAVFDFRCQSV